MIVEVATAGMMYMADATPTKSPADYLNPLSLAVSIADGVSNHIEESSKQKPKPVISQEKLDMFKKWEKEDWLKDDPYRDMWDKDWIKKKN
jgi:hypothetical protein